MEHKGTLVLETERLILRKFTREDAQSMFENWASDSNVTKYLTWSTHSNIEITKMILDDWIKSYENSDFYQWAIELKTIGQPIGTISVVRINEEVAECEIGYCIGVTWWKQGIMTEAFQKVIRFLFEEVKANRISAKHDTENPASGKVMQKSGLIYEGTLRQAGRNNTNSPCDIAIYAILKNSQKIKGE